MRWRPALLLLGVFLLAACSGSDSGSSSPVADASRGSATATTAATAAPATTTPAATASATAATTATRTVTATPTATRTATPTATPAPASVGSFEALLAYIPDTKDTRLFLQMADFDRFRRAFGIQPPADPADQKQKEAYLAALSAATVQGARGFGGGFASGYGPYAAVLPIERYLGYRRVDADVLAGNPPHWYEVVRGQFDPAVADRAISSCKPEECPIAVKRGQAQGVSYYIWGEDYQQNLRSRLQPPALDELGRGGRIAVTEQALLRALGTEDMESMLKAWKTGAGSLAQADDVRLAARAMDRLGAHAVMFTSATQSKSDGAAEIATATGPARAALEAIYNPPAGTAILEPYTYIGAGPGREGSTPYTYVVLVHASEQAAQQNAALVTRRVAETNSLLDLRPWRERVDAVETKVDGRVLEVKLKGATFGQQFLIARDPLFLHR